MSISLPKLCAPAPRHATHSPSTPGSQNFVGSAKAWELNTNKVNTRTGLLTLFVQFMDGTAGQKQAVKDTLTSSASKLTWADYANVQFLWETSNYDIRVSFAPTGTSWSCVGTDARHPDYAGKATMNLGWLPPDVSTPSEDDRGTILHEFGHALGLMHEHQSPARGGFIHIKQRAAYAYYLPLLNNDRDLVRSQVIDVYNSKDVAAFSKVDRYSIMMYPMDPTLNEEGIRINANKKLSELDKAFVTLMYPPDLSNKENRTRYTTAMETAGISEPEMAVILAAWSEKVPETVEPGTDIREGLVALRSAFVEQNKRAMINYRTNANLLDQVDLNVPWKESGIMDFFTGLGKNKMFKSIVKTVAQEVFQQNGIRTTQGLDSETDMLETIGQLVSHPKVHITVSDSLTRLTRTPPEAADKQWLDKIAKAEEHTDT